LTFKPCANSYDEVPYSSYPYAVSHPNHLAKVAVLLGLNPPRRSYRVLELGCASGGNLIPMAATQPDCHFVGIDYSTRQIAVGQSTVEQLGLENVELRAQSILDMENTLGPFDYIICHGVYSWVSSEVQTKILELCRQLLTEQGIAYISYNTQPGWRQRGALRDMMQYHVQRQVGSSPAERIAQARGLLEFLVNATAPSDSSYARLLREQQELLAQHSDSYIFHEHLEQHNEPLWFLDFCHRLDQHGLRYLGEADFSSMVANKSLSPELQEQLDQLAANLTEKEQYMDFVRNRSFRQTLVCHARQRPNYSVRGERLRGLWAATPGRVRGKTSIAGDVSTDDGAGWELKVEQGPALSTSVRSTQLAFELLSRAWPERIAVSELVDQVAQQLAVPALERGQLEASLEVALLTAFSSSGGQLLELSVSPLPPVDREPSENQFVCVSKLARLQARQGMPLVNRRHELFSLMPIDRRILPLLDGSRDNTSVLNELLQQYQAGDLVVADEHDVPIANPQQVSDILSHLLPQRIEIYQRNSLLEPPFVGSAGTGPDGGPEHEAIDGSCQL
jgi:cyclopropane fatty-acyl-phospholipid synthase-like methyltransferase